VDTPAPAPKASAPTPKPPPAPVKPPVAKAPAPAPAKAPSKDSDSSGRLSIFDLGDDDKAPAAKVNIRSIAGVLTYPSSELEIAIFCILLISHLDLLLFLCCVMYV